jgi:hypothetical protein
LCIALIVALRLLVLLVSLLAGLIAPLRFFALSLLLLLARAHLLPLLAGES